MSLLKRIIFTMIGALISHHLIADPITIFQIVIPKAVLTLFFAISLDCIEYFYWKRFKNIILSLTNLIAVLYIWFF